MTCQLGPGAFGQKHFGYFAPPGRYEKTRRKAHASHTRGDTKKKVEKTTHLTRTQQQHNSSRCWSCRNPAAPTKHPTPLKAITIAQTLGGNYRRPGEAAPTRDGTLAPAAATVGSARIQRVPIPRVHPLSFELERILGPKGRHSYR